MTSAKAPPLELGQTVATAGAHEAASNAGVDLSDYIARHQHHDWGDLCAQDAATNRAAVKPDTQARVMSVYKLPAFTLWIITEWDRSVTTCLLPHEY